MNAKKPISYVKGYTFSFKDEGNIIDAWFSCLSGLEKIFVNGVLVSKKRNYSKDSSSTFKVGENEYSTTIHVKNILIGPFVCTLNKNGKAYGRQKLVFIKMRDLLNLKFIVSAVSLVTIAAALHTFAGLPHILAIVLLLVGFPFLFNKNILPIAWVEDDKIV